MLFDFLWYLVESLSSKFTVKFRWILSVGHYIWLEFTVVVIVPLQRFLKLLPVDMSEDYV